MIFRIFYDKFDLPVNVLIWCFMSTLYPAIFFALYAPTNEWGPIDV
jgi:hypothetical protein